MLNICAALRCAVFSESSHHVFLASLALFGVVRRRRYKVPASRPSALDGELCMRYVARLRVLSLTEHHLPELGRRLV